jgi:hypothetical protein
VNCAAWVDVAELARERSILKPRLKLEVDREGVLSRDPRLDLSERPLRA